MRTFIASDVIFACWNGQEDAVQFFQEIENGRGSYFVAAAAFTELEGLLKKKKVSTDDAATYLGSLITTRNISLATSVDPIRLLSLYESGIPYELALHSAYLEPGDTIVSNNSDYASVTDISYRILGSKVAPSDTPRFSLISSPRN